MWRADAESQESGGWPPERGGGLTALWRRQGRAASIPRTRRAGRRGGGGAAGGQSLIEMAFAIPLLMLILLGTLDLGQVFFDYIQLRGAVVEGASYGARNPTNTAGITTAVTDSGVPSGTTVTVSTSGSCTTVNGTGTISVQASSVFRPLTTSFFARFGLDTWNLSSSATMRCLT